MVILNTILNATLGDDYYPKTEKIHDSGNHANLNYQIIADRQTRKLTILIVVILLYTPTISMMLYSYSIETDKIMSDSAIEGYTKLMIHIAD